MKVDLVYKKLCDLINRQYAIGDRLPTENALSLQFNVARSTLRKVIKQLIEQDIVISYQGKGCFVKNKPSPTTNLFIEAYTANNDNITIKILHYQLVTIPATIAHKLNLSINDRAYYVQRLVYFDNQPQQIQESFLPVKFFPELCYDDVLHPTFEIIKKYISLADINSYLYFTPCIADSITANALNIDKGKLLQQQILLVTNKQGLGINYSITSYCCEKNNHHFTLRFNDES
ncbi:hypothetical protein DKK70_05035 [Gilliamella apicola]|uniref:HTH gntR-type domain-containing protein n=1 Tax=Gilliamella apicola TaxID=1196095 RepID=A0A2V4E1Z8_9GAMM|nr:GntR family transcriptional regulator [Gilliamella apicola]PXZ07220.1 hypothetical protein DKK70_05035 [Gilliamella apicola]